MTDGYTWHLDPELAGLVRDFAADCDRTFEDAARILLLNGLAYSIAIAMERGTCTDQTLYARIQGASMQAPTDAPREVHAPGQQRPVR